MAKTLLKVSFFAVNLTYAVVALTLIAGTVWYSVKLKEVTDLRNPDRHRLDMNLNFPQNLPYIFTPIGLFALLATCCGFCGTNNRAALIVYNVFAFIVFLCCLGAAVAMLLVAVDKSKDFIANTLTEIVQEINNRPGLGEEFKKFEINLNCCGAAGPAEHNPIPEHCYTVRNGRFGSGTSQKAGCTEVAVWVTSLAIYFICGASVFVAILCLVSILISCLLISKLGSKNIKM